MSLQNRVSELERTPLQPLNPSSSPEQVKQDTVASHAVVSQYPASDNTLSPGMPDRHAARTILECAPCHVVHSLSEVTPSTDVSERIEPGVTMQCCCCGKPFDTREGYVHPHGYFYCDEDVWLLAEKGEFYCGD